MDPLKTLVLAAGKSSRIASVSGGTPKPLLPLAGEAIIRRNLRWLARQGIKEIWINLHFQPDEIRQAVGDGSDLGLQIHYIYETDILGTAGAVKNLSNEWHETFLVVYGDNIYSLGLDSFLSFHREKQSLISIALFDTAVHPNTGIAGGRVKLAHDGRVLGFYEGLSNPALSLVNTGLYLLEPEVVEKIPTNTFCDFGRDLFPMLLTLGEAIYAHIITGYCLGVDTPESYLKATELIEKGEVKLS